MKNQNYYVLKTIYKLSRKSNDNYVPLDVLASRKCQNDTIYHLEYNKLVYCKRENKSDYYCITLDGIECMLKHKRDNFNTIVSAIAAVASVIAIILTLFELCRV
jgi:hypothetical protein